MKTITIPYKAFTYSRAASTLVAEHSDLAAQMHMPQRGFSPGFRVQGQQDTILYQRAVDQDVYAGRGGDRELVAAVYAPAQPWAGRKDVPLVHVLND